MLYTHKHSKWILDCFQSAFSSNDAQSMPVHHLLLYEMGVKMGSNTNTYSLTIWYASSNFENLIALQSY